MTTKAATQPKKQTPAELYRIKKQYEKDFTEAVKKHLAEAFRQKKHLIWWATKHKIDMPPGKIDKASALLYVATKLAEREVDKRYHAITVESFEQQLEKMDRKDKMVMKKQYTSEPGTITKVKVVNKPTKKGDSHNSKPPVVKEEEEEEKFDKLDQKDFEDLEQQALDSKHESEKNPADYGFDPYAETSTSTEKRGDEEERKESSV